MIFTVVQDVQIQVIFYAQNVAEVVRRIVKTGRVYRVGQLVYHVAVPMRRRPATGPSVAGRGIIVPARIDVWIIQQFLKQDL